jgi:hypothetical protein
VADLRYIDAAGHVCTARLGAEHFLIGRANTCQIVFVDDMVSREHARLDRDADGRYRIRDLGSRNKTVVNAQQINETILVNGDVIRIGDHVVEFLDDTGPREKLSLDFLTPDRKEPGGSEWVKIKAPVTLALDQVSSLTASMSFLGTTVRAEDIAEAGLSRVIHDLQAERGFVARRGEHKGELIPIAHRGLSIQPGGSRMPVSQAFVTAALLQQVGGRYPRDTSQIDLKSGYAATGLVAPLVHGKDILGILYVDKAKATQPFSAMAVQYITAAGAAIGGAMAEATRRLTDESIHAEAAWLATARRTQAWLGVVPQAQSPFESAWKMLPGNVRCGDLCDLITVDERRCVIVLIDAGGSGVIGLAQGAALRTGLRAAVSVAADPMDFAGVFDGLNRGLAGQSHRQTVTCLAVGLDLAAGRITYINAGGMPPLLMAGPGRLITLDQPALVPGVDGQYAYETSSVDLPADFRLVCHTDGLTVATNATGEVFGDQRMHEVLLDRDAFTEPASVVDRVLEAVASHTGGKPSDDDGSVLVIGKS